MRSSCTCRIAGNFSGHSATEGCVMLKAFAMADCEPNHRMASDLVMSAASTGMPIINVNRHTDVAFCKNQLMTMGKRIKSLRQIRGLNQKQASALARISQPSWSDLETGETKIEEVK